MEYLKYIDFYFLKIKIIILLIFELFLFVKTVMAIIRMKKEYFYIISHILIMLLFYYSYVDFSYMIIVIILYFVSTGLNLRILRKVKFLKEIYIECENLKTFYELNEIYVLADYDFKIRRNLLNKSLYHKYKRKEGKLQEKIITRILLRVLLAMFLIPLIIFLFKTATWETIKDITKYTGSYMLSFASIIGGIAQLGISFIIFLLILYFIFKSILASMYKYPIYQKNKLE